MNIWIITLESGAKVSWALAEWDNPWDIECAVDVAPGGSLVV
jgi:hypothetical protein